MKSILIIGAKGNLGRDFIKYFSKKYEVIGLDRDEMDITNKQTVMRKLSKIKPDIIINCAALINIDYCEENPKEAYFVNVYGTKNIAEAAMKHGCYLVHISTDYTVNPVNEYSWSKLLAEEAVIFAKGLVVRTTYYNENHWLIKAMRNGENVKVLTTHYNNPTYSMTLAETISKLISKNAKGIINIGTKNKINYHDFALKVAEIIGYDKKKIVPVKSIDWKVERPKDTFLETTRLKKLGIKVNSVDDDIKKLFNEA